MAKDEHITILFRKYLAGTYTSEELDGLLRYFELEDSSGRLTELIEQELARPTPDATYSERVQAIQSRVADRLALKRPGRRLVRWLPYAAAILMVALAGAWWFFSADSKPPVTAITLAADIAPGGNRATLTLADGRTIALSEAQTGIVVSDGVNYVDGSEVADVGQEHLMADSPHPMSLTTPKGGTYQITLPDGTKVWLNAASTLKYPSQFGGDERVVELTGEAYFEVQRTGHETPDNGQQAPAEASSATSFVPFLVKTDNQTVEVLGTKFNISAYANDQDTRTTLVEGKVRVEAAGASVSLMPGQQGALTASGLTKQQVDVQQYIAWKDGRFAFQGADIQTVMKQLARWYDIEVVYQGDVPAGTFNGKIDRNLTLDQLLRGLAQTEISYTIHGRTLTIIGKE